MYQKTDSNKTPQNKHTLKVIRVACSSTLNHHNSGLDNQLARLKSKVEENYEGSVEYTDLATQGSGENFEREKLRQLEELIASGGYDWVVTEDLTRISRRSSFVDICRLCEDAGTRLIAFNDRIDTSEEGYSGTNEGALSHFIK